MGLAAILQLLNLAVPAIANVVLMFKNADGSTTALISSTQVQNADDQAAIKTWLAQHQATSAAKA